MDVLLYPGLWLLIALLVILGVAFSFVKFELGKEGWEAVLKKHPKIGQKRVDRVTSWYERRGSIVLIVSAVPGIDTLVSVTAGAFGARPRTFLIWVTIAKSGRFIILAVLMALIVEFLQR